MARHRSRRHRTRSRSRRMAGGASSAATYEMGAVGTTDQQFARVFDQAGPYGNIPGNSIIGTGGQGIESASRLPTAQNLALVQSAGRRRRRGGFLGEVINQAIVPAALLGMQQTYRRKRRGGKRTRRHHRH